jgi:hypothetical protein
MGIVVVVVVVVVALSPGADSPPQAATHTNSESAQRA